MDCIFLMENYNEAGCVNVGCGTDISIKDLAILIKEIVGYEGEIVFDSSKPDGTLRKLMDVSKINEMGWRYSIGVREGIMKVYNEYKIKVANK